MGALTSDLYTQLVQVEWFGFYTTYLNDYFPFGSFWWLLGFVMLGVLHIKIKNLAYVAAVGALYFVGITTVPGLVTDFGAQLALRIFGILCGIVLGIYLYFTVKS